MSVELPSQRVYRPANDKMNIMINKLMQIHARQKHIQRVSWTEYVSYLINKDLREIRENTQRRFS